MQILNLSLDEIKPYENNPRVNTPAVDAVANSIREFGFTVPIVIDAAHVIIAGHTRLYAARKLGLTEAPVVIAELDERAAKALRIADNKVAEIAKWDKDLLNIELRAIGDALDMADFGFDNKDLDGLFDDDKPEEEAELPPEPRSKPGTLYILGDHRLLCGDSCSSADVARLMDGEKAALCFTDPPYNVAYKGTAGSIMNDNLGDDFPRFMFDAMSRAVESTEGDIYVAMSSSELCTLADQFQNAGGKLDGWIIWEKNTFTLGHSDFQRQFEPIMLGHSGRVGHENPVKGVWVADKPTKNKVHPTMKPIELVQMAIKASSHRGDAVLDLFG